MKRTQSIYATPSQVQYLRHLMDTAFARRVGHGLVVRDWSRLLRSDASRMIATVLSALGRERVARCESV